MGNSYRNFASAMFTVGDIAGRLGITPASARVNASRQVQCGNFLRLKNNLYILTDDWSKADILFRYRIANRIQVPSYISLLSALSWYDLTTQIQQGFIESMAQKRSYRKTIQGTEFHYFLLSSNLYFGFSRLNGVFIAEAEKALADGIYLMSLGRYSLDFSALAWERINQERFNQILVDYPDYTRRWWSANGNF
ncbi:MAG: hypothetical protein HQ562_00895 [Candidatus Marinimicrobia bacterium]|nr:hypothetical protein [Candidatus Neomarinimicrobiota bacterium]